MKLGVDVLPKTVIPMFSSDYASKSLSGLFYYPLVENKTNSKSIATIEEKESLVWTLKLKEGMYWSNGELIKVSQILDSWIFASDNNLRISKELDFIVNWKKWRLGEIPFEKVGIKISNNSLIICLQYGLDIAKMLGNIEFTPIYLDNNKGFLPISSGTFVPNIVGKEFIYNFNKHNIDNIREKLELIFVDNIEESNRLYKSGKIDVTPTTLYKASLLDKMVGVTNFKVSNIHVSLLLISNRAKGMKKELLNKIKNTELNFLNLEKYSNYFFQSEVSEEQTLKSINDKNQKIKLVIGIADYYPNREIVETILDGYHIIIKMIPLEFLKDRSVLKNLDMLCILYTTMVVSDVSLLLSYIPYIEEKEIDCYIGLLNKYDINNLTIVEKRELNSYLENNSSLIPIGNIIHGYKKRKESIPFFIDENDVYFS
jgi:hypothetical protein